MKPPVWYPAYVAVGSNLDDPIAKVTAAFETLAGLPDTRLAARSGLYRSRPFGPVEQPDFINAVAGLLTRLDPHRLLASLLEIERVFGRRRDHQKWGPRELDLDLLLHGGLRIDDKDLSLPHPGMHERNFVLYPLAEIAPSLRLGDDTIKRIADRLGSAGLVRIQD